MRQACSWFVAGLSIVAGTARAELTPTGNGLVNHVDANLTWVADANLFVTQAAANPDLVADIVRLRYLTMPDPYRGARPWEDALDAGEFSTATGAMTHHAAVAWINYLNLTNYKGYSDWRIPVSKPLGNRCFEFWCSVGEGPISSLEDVELYRLFYQELGGTEGQDLVTTHNASFDLFSNLATRAFWIHFDPPGPDAYMPTSGKIHYTNWEFVFQDQKSVWPVRTGLSSATPPPIPHLALDRHSFVFPEQLAGTSSVAREVEIWNSGTGAAPISIAVTDVFSVTSDCPATLAAGASCVASVRYSPTTIGQHVGSLAVSGDGSDHVVALSGRSDINVSLIASTSTATAGAPVTLTWSALPATAECTSSGGQAPDGWAGPIPSAGSRVVTQSTAGSQTYEIRCVDSSRSRSSQVPVSYTMPTVTLISSATDVTEGGSHTLTWTSANAERCIATGNGSTAVWGGEKPVNGSAVLGETTLGSITYTLTCSSSPQSVQGSVRVFVHAAQKAEPPGGGGGVMGMQALLALLGLTALRVRARLKQ
jgi:hypothetical protein